MAINVISKSREISKIEQYLMTLSPAITSIKDVPDGTIIPVSAFLIFEDEKRDGDVSTIVSVLTPDKKVFSAQSATFRQSLIDIDECMDGAAYSIIKKSGKTKAGRDFVTCELDVTSI